MALVEDAGVDALDLIEAVDNLHEGVIEGVTDGSDRGQDLHESEMIGVYWPVEHGLRPGIAVMDQLAGDSGVALSTSFPQRHPQQDHDQLRLLGSQACQATIRWANRSTMNMT